MYIKCPACDKDILIDEFTQAMGIALSGCQFHSETKNFDGKYFFKRNDHEVISPRVRLTGGQWISIAEHDEMIKERKRNFYQKKREAEADKKKQEYATRKDWD